MRDVGCGDMLADRISSKTGPNVYGIPYDVPEYCTVEQAFYVSRHGSRYPDRGAYTGWVDMKNRVGILFPSCPVLLSCHPVLLLC